MLHWNSEVWGKLIGPYGSAGNVPALLQQLQAEYHQEVFDELFQEYLFHQNTIYTVTYAAMPFLAQLACTTTDAEVRQELFINCGIIEASRDAHDEASFLASCAELAADIGNSACVALYYDYEEAVNVFRKLAATVLAHAAQQSIDEAEKRYLLIADAAYRGSYVTANMLLTFSSADEYVAVCSACDEEMYLWPSEDNVGILQAYQEDPVFHTSQPPHLIVPVVSFVDEEVQALAEQATAIGEQTLAQQLHYLAGETNCPSCKEKVAIWPALLSTFII